MWVTIVWAGRAKKYNSRCYFDYITTCHIPTGAYIHRHKLQKRYEGFNAQGPSEVVYLVMSIDSLIVNGESTKREVTEIQNPTGNCFDKYRMKKIYETPPHIFK